MVTLTQALRYQHLSTFPSTSQYPISDEFYDTGGPASIYVIRQGWAQTVRMFGLTLGNPAGTSFALAAKVFEFTDCTTLSSNWSPSVCQRTSYLRCDLTQSATVEVDKEIELLEFTDCNIGFITIQSASVELATFRACQISHLKQDNAKAIRVTDCRIRILDIEGNYGNALQRVYTNCLIFQFNIEEGTAVPSLLLSAFTFSNGVFSRALAPSSANYFGFGIPGSPAFFSDSSSANYGSPFQITGITTGSGNLEISTTLSALPTYVGALSATKTILHLAPSISFDNCTGNPLIVQLSQTPKGQPWFTYGYWELTNENLAAIPGLAAIGFITKLRVNVRKAYTGAQSTMLLHAFGSSGMVGFSVSGTTWTEVTPDPCFDLKVAGERVITATKVNGLAPKRHRCEE